MNQYKFIKSSYKKEKELLCNSVSNIALSSRNTLIRLLYIEDFEELTYISSDNIRYKLDEISSLNIEVNGVGTFHFYFNEDIDIELVKEKVLSIKSKTSKDKIEQVNKINNMFDIVNQYKPLFGYITFAYKYVNELNISNLDYPFLYVDKSEYKDIEIKSGFNRFFTEPVTYFNILISLVFTNTIGFIGNSIFSKDAFIVLFIFILLACIVLYFILEHYFNIEEPNTFIRKHDIVNYLPSLIGFILGGVVYYFLVTKLLKPSVIPPINEYITLSISIGLDIILLVKVIVYYFNQHKKNKDNF